MYIPDIFFALAVLGLLFYGVRGELRLRKLEAMMSFDARLRKLEASVYNAKRKDTQ